MKRNSWPNPCNWVKSICSNFETHNRFRIETFASVTQTLKCRRRSMSAVDRETAAVHFTASVVIHSPERLQFLSIWRWWTRENEIWKQENSRHSEWEFIFFSFAGMAQFPSSFVFFWVQLYLNGDLIVILKKETQSLVKIVFLHSKLTMNFKKGDQVWLPIYALSSTILKKNSRVFSLQGVVILLTKIQLCTQKDLQKGLCKKLQTWKKPAFQFIASGFRNVKIEGGLLILSNAEPKPRGRKLFKPHDVHPQNQQNTFFAFI